MKPMEECMICLEDYLDFVTLPCEHELCAKCYEKIMTSSGKCPLCEAELQKWPSVTARVGPYDDPRCCCIVAFMGCVVSLTMCFIFVTTMISNH